MNLTLCVSVFNFGILKSFYFILNIGYYSYYSGRFPYWHDITNNCILYFCNHSLTSLISTTKALNMLQFACLCMCDVYFENVRNVDILPRLMYESFTVK